MQGEMHISREWRFTIHKIQNWDRFLSNREDLSALYVSIPMLDIVTLRSVHFNRLGPTVTLRIDLAEFPDRPRQEWTDAGCDRLEFQLQLLDVESLEMAQVSLPAEMKLSVHLLEDRRLKVAARAGVSELKLTCKDHIRVGRINAYKSSDPSIRFQSTGLGRKLWHKLPDPYARVYYESL
jgi:Immunity protein 50